MDALKRAEKARQAQADDSGGPGGESDDGHEPELTLDPLDPSQPLESVKAKEAVEPPVALDLSLDSTGDGVALDVEQGTADAGPRTDESDMSQSMDFGDLSLDDTSATLPSMKSAQRSVDDYFDGTHSMSMSMEQVRTAIEEEEASGAHSKADLSATRSGTTSKQTARVVFDAKAVAPPRSGRVISMVVLPLLVLALVAGGGFVYWDELLKLVEDKPSLVVKRPQQPAPPPPAVPAVPAVPAAPATPAMAAADQSPPPQIMAAADSATEQQNQQANQPAVTVEVPPAPIPPAQSSSSEQQSGTLVEAVPDIEASAATPDPAAAEVVSTEPAQAVEPVQTSEAEAENLQAMADQALREALPTAAVDLPAKLRDLESAGAPRPGPVSFKITRNRKPDRVHKDLLKAYEAFQQGANERAMAAYRKVLKRRPEDRDALLGVAALEIRVGNLEQATKIYYRLLSSNPRDALVQSALISLREDVDPVAGESSIKNLLQEHPGSANLHFNLGNLFARQLRWSEAQQAYFNAYRLDVGNPDYAYNLAISLDHLAKSRTALQFYQLAVDLADSQPASFAQSEALQRIGMINAPQ